MLGDITPLKGTESFKITFFYYKCMVASLKVFTLLNSNVMGFESTCRRVYFKSSQV
jgi:hypothetical protein